MSEYEFIIYDGDPHSEENIREYKKEKKRYAELMLPFLKSNKLGKRDYRKSAQEFKSCTLEYYALLKDGDRQIFRKYFDNFLMQYIKQNTAPIEMDYDDWKTILHLVRKDTFWNVEPTTNPVFETDSNERFFNYVMGVFKDDVKCYKQKTLSYMYWVLIKAVCHRGMYIRYVNDHYAKELNPIDKIKTGLNSEPKVEEYNQVFRKAQSKWNEENPLYIKKFETLIYVN